MRKQDFLRFVQKSIQEAKGLKNKIGLVTMGNKEGIKNVLGKILRGYKKNRRK